MSGRVHGQDNHQQISANAQTRHSHTYDYQTLLSKGKTTGIALLPLMVNDHLQGTFLLDTGCTFSCLSEQAVKKLGLTERPALFNDKPVIFDGQPASIVNVSSAKTLDGKLNFNGEFVVLKSSDLATVPEFQGIDGVIGINMLSAPGILWDFPQHRITFYIPGTLSQQEKNELGFVGAGIPLTQERESKMFYAPVVVTADKGTGQETALVDTGSDQSILSASLARQLKLQPLGGTSPSRSVLGTKPILSSPLVALRLGNESLISPIVHYSVQDSAWPPPLLGLDVLSQFRVLFDFQQGMMYLAPATSPVPNITIKPMLPVPSTQPEAARTISTTGTRC